MLTPQCNEKLPGGIYCKKLGTARLLSIRRSFFELASKAKDLCAS